MCILSYGLVEQTPVRRQVGASASDGADNIAGSPGTARRRGVRIADQRLPDHFSDERRQRHVVPPSFPRERDMQFSAGGLRARAIMDRW